MVYIIGKITDKTILEKVEIDSPVDLKAYKDAIVNNYGGKPEDYSIMVLENSDLKAYKVVRAFFFDAVWKEDAITDFDFSKYESKPTPDLAVS